MNKKPLSLTEKYPEKYGAKATASSSTTPSSNVPLPDVGYPVANYGELKQNVQLWCDRDDAEFVNQIPNFIDMAQKEIYRSLRIQPMKKEAYLEIDNGKASLPVDYLQGDYMFFALNGVFFREATQTEWSAEANSVRPNMDTPDLNYIMENNIEPIFTRVGNRLFFWPEISSEVPVQNSYFTGAIPDSAVVFGYYSDPQRMNSDSDEPYLLDIAPDLFLYMTLKHASLFVADVDKSQAAAKQAQTILNTIQEQDNESVFTTSPLAVKAANVHSYWG